MHQLLRGMPGAGALNDAKMKIDSLPAIIDALGKLPATLAAMPPAPVVMGAVSRMVASAIAEELTQRGPSPAFLRACEAAEVRDHQAAQLYTILVAELLR